VVKLAIPICHNQELSSAVQGLAGKPSSLEAASSHV
jgi:hypothetical protein